MNVLFLTHSYPQREGDAAGSFLLRLAVALRDEDVRVKVVAPAGPGLPATETLEGIPIERFRYAPRRFEKLAYTGNMAKDVASSWSARLALVGFMGSDFVHAVRARREFEPDVIHAHWWFPNGLIGTWLRGLSHVPMVTTLHGTDVRLAKTVGVARPLFRHVMGHSTAVTAVSRWLRDEAEKLAPGTNATVAPMPVATNLFKPGAPKGKRLLFVGRFSAQKGLEHLLHALALMKGTTALDIVGEGAGKEALQKIAGELGLGARVSWLGQVPRRELPGLYQRAAAVVVPSIDEGLGLVAVEALLSETPVVAFDSGGLRDVIQNGKTGMLVPPGDRQALAAALDEVIGSGEAAMDLAKAGRLYALSTFAPESVARRYAGIYRQVLGGIA